MPLRCSFVTSEQIWRPLSIFISISYAYNIIIEVTKKEGMVRSVYVCVYSKIASSKHKNNINSNCIHFSKKRNWYHVGRLNRFVNIGFFRIRRVCILIVWFILLLIFVLLLALLLIFVVVFFFVFVFVFYFEFEMLPLRASRQSLVPWD